jgi:hypothetical protein
LEDPVLFLAAEDCPPDEFESKHSFVEHDERLLRALVAHGPVLIRGGRGAGKSALMIEANRRLQLDPLRIGFYVSLRYLPLLETTGADYLRNLAQLCSAEIAKAVSHIPGLLVGSVSSIEELKSILLYIAHTLKKRVVLLFDDAAHIGREASLDEFFDSFRMLSSAEISCKASIYPGVTRFGVRFDVYNDATVMDVSKDERSLGFDAFFLGVIGKRNPNILPKISQYKGIKAEEIAGFLGRAVLGNMRSFAIAINRLEEYPIFDHIHTLTDLLINLSGGHFWPLLEEVTPKLGKYEPLAVTSGEVAQVLFAIAGEYRNANVAIRRDICQGLAKPLEILEYVGFITKKEASRAVKGGRGPKYRLNLAVLLENIKNKKLSGELVAEWRDPNQPTLEIAPPTKLQDILMPTLSTQETLSVLDLPVERLQKSKIYPYGLTGDKISKLQQANFLTVRSLAAASDQQLDSIYGVGEAWIKRIRDVIGQAVWM